jgi:adenylosuccinate synthase
LLRDRGLTERVRKIIADRRTSLLAAYGPDIELDLDAVLSDISAAKAGLASFVCDTTALLHDAMDAHTPILFEGANGMLLDVDHGTYPFVTSSSTGPHGIGPGAGIPTSKVSLLIGTTKAYATRVGSGPFVSELKGEIGGLIRQRGKEFGTTTGRPRRCGWFDAVSCRYTARLSGVTDIALMHLDTLSGLDQVGICTAYRLGDDAIRALPADAELLEQAEPVIEFMAGWDDDLSSVRQFEDLPVAARAYVERIEALVGADVSIIGVGPDRSQTLVRGRPGDLIHAPEQAGK